MPNAVFLAEPIIRLGCFLGVLAMMGLWEALAPRRPQFVERRLRWPNNLGLVVLDTVIVRLLFPLTAVGVAFLAQANGWGLFNLVALPAWAAIPAAVLLLDLTIYGQHVAFHAVPMLWRLHRMHHADLEFDVTTGLRFHPGEIVLSMLIKFAAVLALGAAPLAVLVFEVLLNATAMFNHGNVALPPRLDRVLRLVVVTPEMHRVHHSILRRGDGQQFRLQSALVGSAVRHVPRATFTGSSAHDARHRPVPRSSGAVARSHAVAAAAQRPAANRAQADTP